MKHTRLLRWQFAACFVGLALMAGCRPSAVWSPDSRQIALEEHGVVLTFDTQTHKFSPRTKGPRAALGPSWSPDGKKLAFFRATFTNDLATLSLVTLNPATGVETPLIAKLPVPPMENAPGPKGEALLDLYRESLGISWSPDGKRLALQVPSRHEFTTMTANADGTGLRRLTPAESLMATWSPDAKTIAFSTFQTIEKASPDGTERKVLFDFAPNNRKSAQLTAMTWAPDGKALLVLFDDQPKMQNAFPESGELWSIPLDGTPAARLAKVPGPGVVASFSQSGTLAFLDSPDPEMKIARFNILAPPYAMSKVAGQVSATALAADEKGEPRVSRIPVLSVAPDGKTLALPVLKEKQPGSLVIQPVDGGPLQTYPVPKVSYITAAPLKAPVKGKGKR